MKRSRCHRHGIDVQSSHARRVHRGRARLLAGVPARLGGRLGQMAAVALLLVLLVGTGVLTGAARPGAAVASSGLDQPPNPFGRAVSGDRTSDSGPGMLAQQDEAATPAGPPWWRQVRDAVSGVPDAVSGVAGVVGGQPATPPPMTILLLGVDARPGETIDAGVRADAILLLRLDPEARACRVLAVPRDSRTDLPGYGQSKINHALAVGGVPYQTDVVERFLGLEIDRFALADFRAFAIAVDAIGGVKITVDEPFTSGDVSFPAGEQRLTGNQALAYVRYRGDAAGDFGRIARQQQMLRAIAAQASGLDLLRGFGDILLAIERHFRTDLTLAEIGGLIAYYQESCGPDAIAMHALTGEAATYPDPLVGQDLSYVVVSDADKAAGVSFLLGEDR